MDLGFGELVVILVIVLIFFGGAKLPALGAGLGKALRNLKDGMRASPPEAGPPAASPPVEPRRELPPGGDPR